MKWNTRTRALGFILISRVKCIPCVRVEIRSTRRPSWISHACSEWYHWRKISSSPSHVLYFIQCVCSPVMLMFNFRFRSRPSDREMFGFSLFDIFASRLSFILFTRSLHARPPILSHLTTSWISQVSLLRILSRRVSPEWCGKGRYVKTLRFSFPLFLGIWWRFRSRFNGKSLQVSHKFHVSLLTICLSSKLSM